MVIEMEKQTRVNKYKELREEMKEEVAINRHMEETVCDEEDDFLAFLPKKEEKKIEDTLLEPLTYETLDHDNDHVKHALNKAKVNVGKEQYDTRLDILLKIKNEEKLKSEQQKQPVVHEEVQEPVRKMSLLEKLAAISPEEDVKELEKYEEELTVEELMKKDKKRKKEKKVVEEKPIKKEKKVQRKKVVEKEIVEDDDGEEESKLVTILNYVIIAFMIVFVVLVFFIAKQIFFN